MSPPVPFYHPAVHAGSHLLCTACIKTVAFMNNTKLAFMLLPGTAYLDWGF